MLAALESESFTLTSKQDAGSGTPEDTRESEATGSEGRIFELLVVAGDNTGGRFTIDTAEVTIGRGDPRQCTPSSIFLDDPAISSRQGYFSLDNQQLIWRAEDSATNPTRINGHATAHCTLSEGDELEMGSTRLAVKERSGFRLNTMEHMLTTQQTEVDPDPLSEPTTRILGVTSDATQVIQRPDTYASLILEQGVPGLVGKSFPLLESSTSIGRGQDCDILVSDPGVSRDHAILQWDGRRLELHHRSAVNPSLVNGEKVDRRRQLRDGDAIQLADKVVFRLRLTGPPRAEETLMVSVPQGLQKPPSLMERMEQKLALDDSIDRDFHVVGSFLDVDVVGSYNMKTQAKNPQQIILSFERFRAFMGGVVEEHQGLVLNSNGDELMCFFESTPNAVRAGSQILQRLDDFNKSKILLSLPFRFRIGVHTGASLVDKERGVAYSATLDIAGHLQKDADINGLLISDDTLRALPTGLPFQPVGELPVEKITTHRLSGWIE
jgi:pSer/pThr/pTyr-binding forkhead associated (FHA) protein